MFIKLDVKRSLTLSISLYIYKNTDVTIKNKVLSEDSLQKYILKWNYKSQKWNSSYFVAYKIKFIQLITCFVEFSTCLCLKALVPIITICYNHKNWNFCSYSWNNCFLFFIFKISTQLPAPSFSVYVHHFLVVFVRALQINFLKLFSKNYRVNIRRTENMFVIAMTDTV